MDTWNKIIFRQGENPMGRPLELTKLAEQRDQAVGQAKGFAIYSRAEDGCPVLCFSPVASLHCADLLRTWGAVECEPVSDEIVEGLTLQSPVYGKL